MNTQNLMLCCLLAAAVSRAAAADSTPKFENIYQVLSSNLQGVSSDELNRAAVRGLLDQLAPRVSLVEASGAGTSSNAAPLARSCVFDNAFAYLRPAAVADDLPAAFSAAYREMIQTNKGKIKGLVLDLRFAGGLDYPAAAKVADGFLNSDRPLLNWQSGSARATSKTDAISVPVAILVNSQTTGAAEALAAALRESGVGLILGGQTAGQASIFKEFPLQNSARLRVAVGQVSVGAGKTLSGGVLPDIPISSSLDDQRAYLLDPFKVLHPPQTAKTDTAANTAPEQPRLNETELIREHKEGEAAADFPASAKLDTPPPQAVADPVLGRALDLLKGLAVVEPARPG
jgi:carboxyl-terminal processing protease